MQVVIINYGWFFVGSVLFAYGGFLPPFVVLPTLLEGTMDIIGIVVRGRQMYNAGLTICFQLVGPFISLLAM
jgi:hypothetical protein